MREENLRPVPRNSLRNYIHEFICALVLAQVTAPMVGVCRARRVASGVSATRRELPRPLLPKFALAVPSQRSKDGQILQ